MATRGQKTAVGLGVAGIIGGLVLLPRRAGTEPPPPPAPGLANLYGKVTDTTTGQEIAGVSVTLNGLQTETDTNGNYYFLDVEPREYSIQFAKEGYEPVI